MKNWWIPRNRIDLIKIETRQRNDAWRWTVGRMSLDAIALFFIRFMGALDAVIQCGFFSVLNIEQNALQKKEWDLATENKRASIREFCVENKFKFISAS